MARSAFPVPERVLTPLRDGGQMIWIRPDHVDGDLEYFREHGLAGIECEGALLKVIREFGPDHLKVRGLGCDEQLDIIHDMPGIVSLGGYSSGNYKPALDLARFKALKGFNWDNWTHNILFPREMPSLKWLGLSGYRHGQRGGQLPESLPSLTSLTLGYLGKHLALPPLPSAPLVDDVYLVVGGVEELGPLAIRFPKIRTLHLGHLPKLANIEVVRSLRHLRRIELENLRSLADLSPLGDCPDLREVVIDGCKNLASISGIGAHRLERFSMFGSKVADGEMSSLIGVPHVGFDNRRHYSHRVEEIEAATQSGSAVAPPTSSLREAEGTDIDVDIETDDLDAIEAWRARLPDLIAAARQRLDDDPGESGLLYAEHHIAEIESEAWEAVHGLDKAPTVTQLLRLLEPVSLWGDPSEGLHLDFSVSEDLTQYVLSFKVHLDGTLGGIDMES